MDPTTTTPAKKRGIVRRSLPFVITGVVALAIGAGVGGASSGSSTAATKPAPTVTVTAPAPEAEEVEDHSAQLATCQAVAQELQSITADLLTGVITPYHEASVMLLTQLSTVFDYGQGALSISEMERGTQLMTESAEVMDGLRGRTETVTPSYQECLG